MEPILSEFWYATWLVWRAGDLARISPIYKNAASSSFESFLLKEDPLLNAFFRERLPLPREFFVWHNSEVGQLKMVITDRRMWIYDDTAITYDAYYLSDIESYAAVLHSPNWLNSDIHVRMNDGSKRIYKRTSFAVDDKVVRLLSAASRSISKLNANLHEFWQTTWSVWQSGELAPISKAFQVASFSSFEGFLIQDHPFLNEHFLAHPPLSGEFLIMYFPSERKPRTVLTNCRLWIGSDDCDRYDTYTISDIERYEISEGLFNVDLLIILNDGTRRTYRRIKHAFRKELVSLVIAACRSNKGWKDPLICDRQELLPSRLTGKGVWPSLLHQQEKCIKKAEVTEKRRPPYRIWWDMPIAMFAALLVAPYLSGGIVAGVLGGVVGIAVGILTKWSWLAMSIYIICVVVFGVILKVPPLL